MSPLASLRTPARDPHRTLTDYATHLGIKFRPCSPTPAPIWDGDAAQEPSLVSDLAHEIAHWLVATPEQRSLVNYGLGGDYQWPNDGTAAIVTDVEAAELDASALGIQFEALVGADWQDTYELHGWGDAAVAARVTPVGDSTCPGHTQRRDSRCADCVAEDFFVHSDRVSGWVAQFERWLIDHAASGQPDVRHR